MSKYTRAEKLLPLNMLGARCGQASQRVQSHCCGCTALVNAPKNGILILAMERLIMNNQIDPPRTEEPVEDQFLKGNFVTKNSVTMDEVLPAASLTEEYKAKALGSIGGSMVYMERRKLSWDGDD